MDDKTIIRELWTDEQGRTWWAMRRDDGSICLYYTYPGSDTQWVVFDTLDTPAASMAAAGVPSLFDGLEAAT